MNIPHFLKPENIMDAEKKKPSDPKYNNQTLYIPKPFWLKFTPAVR